MRIVPSDHRHVLPAPAACRLLLVLFLLSPSLWRCSENRNPVMEDRQVVTVRVAELQLVPPRKYVSLSEIVPVFFSGIDKGFACAEITALDLMESAGKVSPHVSVLLPENINECALSSPAGTDTLLNMDLGLLNLSAGRVLFAGTDGSVSDSSIAVRYPMAEYFGPGGVAVDVDSSVLADSSLSPFQMIRDSSYHIGCEFDASFWKVCKSPDSLFLYVYGVSGMNLNGCSGNYFVRPDSLFYTEVAPDSSGRCMFSGKAP